MSARSRASGAALLLPAWMMGLACVAGCPVTYDLGSSARSVEAGALVDAPVSSGDASDASANDSDVRDASADVPIYTGPRRVFVTSTMVSSNFAEANDRHAAEPLARADAACVQFAHKAGLGGDWRAWLYGAFGTGEIIQAVDHAHATKGPYVLVDGVTVVFPTASPGDHADSALSMTENGTRVPAGDMAWVGSFGKGCEEVVDGQLLTWANATSSSQGALGKATDRTFWGVTAGQSQPCSKQAHLYCFEQ